MTRLLLLLAVFLAAACLALTAVISMTRPLLLLAVFLAAACLALTAVISMTRLPLLLAVFFAATCLALTAVISMTRLLLLLAVFLASASLALIVVILASGRKYAQRDREYHSRYVRGLAALLSEVKEIADTDGAKLEPLNGRHIEQLGPERDAYLAITEVLLKHTRRANLTLEDKMTIWWQKLIRVGDMRRVVPLDFMVKACATMPGASSKLQVHTENESIIRHVSDPDEIQERLCGFNSYRWRFEKDLAAFYIRLRDTVVPLLYGPVPPEGVPGSLDPSWVKGHIRTGRCFDFLKDIRDVFLSSPIPRDISFDVWLRAKSQRLFRMLEKACTDHDARLDADGVFLTHYLLQAGELLRALPPYADPQKHREASGEVMNSFRDGVLRFLGPRIRQDPAGGSKALIGFLYDILLARGRKTGFNKGRVLMPAIRYRRKEYKRRSREAGAARREQLPNLEKIHGSWFPNGGTDRQSEGATEWPAIAPVCLGRMPDGKCSIDEKERRIGYGELKRHGAFQAGFWDVLNVTRDGTKSTVAAFLVAVERLIPASGYDRILAIATDGLVPATWLSLSFDIPLSMVSISPVFELKPPHLLHERCILVDTILKSGFSIAQTIATVRGRGRFCDPFIAGVLVLALDTRYISEEDRRGLIKTVFPDAGFDDVHRLIDLSSGIDETSSDVYLRWTKDMTAAVSPEAVSCALALLGEKMLGDGDSDERALVTEVLERSRVRNYQHGTVMDFRELLNCPSLLRRVACHWYRKWFAVRSGPQAPAVVCGSKYGLPLAVALSLRSMLASDSAEDRVEVYRASLPYQTIEGIARLRDSGRSVVIVDSTVESGLALFNMWSHLKENGVALERVLVLADRCSLYPDQELANALATSAEVIRQFRYECCRLIEPLCASDSVPSGKAYPI